MIPLFLVFLLLPALSTANQFTCPTDTITTNGVFPVGATSMETFPNRYVCTLNFKIPDGMVVKVTVQSSFKSDQTMAVLSDSTLMRYNFTTGTQTIYVPAPTAHLKIQVLFDTAQFFVKYEMVAMTNFKQVKLRTGDAIPLSLDPQSYYTFYSTPTPYQPKVVLNTAGATPMDLNLIYVFDGEGITSKYRGPLSIVADGVIKSSTGQNFTIVDFHNRQSKGWIIANDNNKIIFYTNYRLQLLSSASRTTSSLVDYSNHFTVTTFICTDCQETYLSQLQFGSRQAQIQNITIFPQSPTASLPSVLSYTDSDNMYQLLPQHIPAKMFTVMVVRASVVMSFESSDDVKSKYLTVAPGRSVTVSSRSVWGDGMNPGMDLSFASSSPVQFTYTLDSLKITSRSENLNLAIGTDSSKMFTDNYNCGSDVSCSFANIGPKIGRGTYFNATYLGQSSASSTLFHFQVSQA